MILAVMEWYNAKMYHECLIPKVRLFLQPKSLFVIPHKLLPKALKSIMSKNMLTWDFTIELV